MSNIIEKLGVAVTKHGIKLLGITDSSCMQAEQARYVAWLEGGFAANMQYMNRDPVMLTSPTYFYSGCKTVIVLGLPYEAAPQPTLKPAHGRIAKYAWGVDYHLVVKDLLSEIVKDAGLASNLLGITSDSFPLLEKPLAARAGLGFIGKNSLLIAPGTGSYFFLAEIFLDIELRASVKLRSDIGCKSCTRCIAECPTKAIVRDGVIDANKCIAYLTIEKRDALTWDERMALGEWLFGCDICQDVCPFNYAESRSNANALSLFRGARQQLSLDTILRLKTTEQFKSMFKESPILRAKRSGLIRNACAVAVNIRSREALPAIKELFLDEHPMVRQHAFWAAAHLEPEPGVRKTLVFKACQDNNDVVRLEGQRLAEFFEYGTIS